MGFDAETHRMMENWARWRVGGMSEIAVSSAFSDSRDGYDTPMPLLNGEALEVNQAVDRLEVHEQRAVVEFWCFSSSVAEKAHSIGCGSIKTLYRRLERAHAFIHAYRRELRRSSERLRAGSSRSYSENATAERQSGRIIPLPLAKPRRG